MIITLQYEQIISNLSANRLAELQLGATKNSYWWENSDVKFCEMSQQIVSFEKWWTLGQINDSFQAVHYCLTFDNSEFHCH